MKRPGCSDWAERIRPQIAAAAGPETPPASTATAPWVTMTEPEVGEALLGEPGLDQRRGPRQVRAVGGFAAGPSASRACGRIEE